MTPVSNPSLDGRRATLRGLAGGLVGGLAGALATAVPGALLPARAFADETVATSTSEALLTAGWTEVKPGELVPPQRRSIRLVNAHTWEDLDIVYRTRGVLIDESLHAISHLMRDHRVGKSIPIDPALVDELYMVHAALGTEEPLHILSGYRTPQTNARLRKRSIGVAKYSLHMEGKAADIYVPGVKTLALQQAALALEVGGVGYYSASGFVHVDTGRVRHWGS